MDVTKVTAFMLVCFLGVKMEGYIYFKNINDCIAYKDRLHNQVIEKNNEEQIYQCMCKLIPEVKDNVRIY
jgi:hypothetical protein